MKVLVTGAGGFLGSHICQYYSGLGEQVWAVGRFSSPQTFRVLCPGIQGLVELDLPSNQMSVTLSLVKPDLLVHCASSASVPLSMMDPLADFRQSAGIYGEILEAVRQKSPDTTVALLSSASVYGHPKILPTPESTPKAPMSPYGYHKWICEVLSREYASIFDIKTLNLRIFSAYGERLCKQVIYDILHKIKAPGSTVIDLYGTGAETRDFIHGQDVAQAIQCIYSSGQVGDFNIASGVETTIGDIAKQLRELCASHHSIHFQGQTRPGDPDHWKADIGKLQSLGFAPQIPLATGLNRVVDWFDNYILC